MMKKALTILAFASLLATQAFAAYVVVLKDGTRYKTRTKWTMVNGKASVTLESGQVMLLNPSDINMPESERVSKLGLGDVNILSDGAQQQSTQPQKQETSLGQAVRAMRPRGTMSPVTPSSKSGTAPVAPAPVVNQLDVRLKDKFERAFENVGIFEHTLAGTNSVIRAEVTADNEEKVFNAISATAFLLGRNAGLDNVQINTVELFLRTTTGGAAGRFQMARVDADAINNKSMSLQDYFIRKVIY